MSQPRIPFRQSPISHFASPQAASPFIGFRFSFGDKTGKHQCKLSQGFSLVVDLELAISFMGTNSKATHLVHSYGARTHIGLLLKPSSPIRRTNDIGCHSGDRTQDLRFNRPSLLPAELSGIMFAVSRLGDRV